jgi:hypothetical protein
MFMFDSSSGYGGVKPFSENETKAVKQFVETHNLSISISYHSYGEYIFIPWCYTSKPTKDEQVFVSIGENISSINKYDLVPVNEPRFPIFPRSIGLSEDWLYGEHNILAFLIELGTSFAPTNTSQVMNLCQMHTGVNLYVCERALVLQTEK